MNIVNIRVIIEYPQKYVSNKGKEETFTLSKEFDFTHIPIVEASITKLAYNLSKAQITSLYDHIKTVYINSLKRECYGAPKEYINSLDFPEGYKFRSIQYDWTDPKGSGANRISSSWNKEFSEYLKNELNYKYGLYKSKNNQKMETNRLDNSVINALLSQIDTITSSIARLADTRDDRFIALIAELTISANEFASELKLATAIKTTDAVQTKLELGESAGKKSEESMEVQKKDLKDVKTEKTQKQSTATSHNSQNSTDSTNTDITASNVENQKSDKKGESAGTVKAEDVPPATSTTENKDVVLTPEQVIRKGIMMARTYLFQDKDKIRTDLDHTTRNAIRNLYKEAITDKSPIVINKQKLVKVNSSLDKMINFTRDEAKVEIKNELLKAAIANQEDPTPAVNTKEDIVAKAEEAAAAGMESVDESTGSAKEVESTTREEVTVKEATVKEESPKELTPEEIELAAEIAIEEASKLGEQKTNASTIQNTGASETSKDQKTGMGTSSAKANTTQKPVLDVTKPESTDKVGEKKSVDSGEVSKTTPVAPTSEEKTTPAVVTDSATPAKESKVITLDNNLHTIEEYRKADSLDSIIEMLLADMPTVISDNTKSIEDYAVDMLKANRAADLMWVETEKVNDPKLKKASTVVKDETYYSIMGINAPTGVNLETTTVPMFNSDIKGFAKKLVESDKFAKVRLLVSKKAA
jgi:hypothetical protein